LFVAFGLGNLVRKEARLLSLGSYETYMKRFRVITALAKGARGRYNAWSVSFEEAITVAKHSSVFRSSCSVETRREGKGDEEGLKRACAGLDVRKIWHLGHSAPFPKRCYFARKKSLGLKSPYRTKTDWSARIVFGSTLGAPLTPPSPL